jgi:hypothetical protein
MLPNYRAFYRHVFRTPGGKEHWWDYFKLFMLPTMAFYKWCLGNSLGHWYLRKTGKIK